MKQSTQSTHKTKRKNKPKPVDLTLQCFRVLGNENMLKTPENLTGRSHQLALEVLLTWRNATEPLFWGTVSIKCTVQQIPLAPKFHALY